MIKTLKKLIEKSNVHNKRNRGRKEKKRKRFAQQQIKNKKKLT